MAGLAARKLYGRDKKCDEEKRPHDKAQAAAFSDLLRRLNLGDPPTFEDVEGSDDEEGVDDSEGAQDPPEEHHHHSTKPLPAKSQSAKVNMSQFISPSGKLDILMIKNTF